MSFAIDKKGTPFFLGFPELEKVPLFGLQVGEQITSIGKVAKSGKQTSSSRITGFTKPVTYAGLYRGETNGYPCTYAAFLLPDGMARGWDLFNPQVPVYDMWVVIEEAGELLMQNWKTCSIYIHKAVFGKEVAHV